MTTEEHHLMDEAFARIVAAERGLAYAELWAPDDADECRLAALRLIIQAEIFLRAVGAEEVVLIAA